MAKVFACYKNFFKAAFKIKDYILLSLRGLRTSVLKFLLKVGLSTNRNKRKWKIIMHNKVGKLSKESNPKRPKF